MKAEEFISELRCNTPLISDYIDRGYSEHLANKVIQSFSIIKKKNNSEFKDELLKLIDGFNVTNFEIGVIKFFNNVEIKQNYFVVGEVEADWLIIDKITGIVKVMDLYSEKELWLCASNGSKFLNAIIEISNFITTTSLDKNWNDDQKILCVVSEECGRIAGGEEFIEFYKMLLGCFQ